MSTTISDLLEAGAEAIAETVVSVSGRGSCIARIDYNYATQTLSIDFVKGGGYEYGGVPPDVVVGLLMADSQGTYFNAFIRNSY